MKYGNFLFRKIINLIVSTWLCVYVVANLGYSIKFSLNNTSLEERVVFIENKIFYRFLHPIGSPLAHTIPFLKVSYINVSNTEKATADVKAVVRHEVKHILQFEELGFYDYYIGIEKWKIEGVAEYVRGMPTLDPCDDSLIGTSGQMNYREYYIAVSYLIDGLGLSENEVYKYGKIPSHEASNWYKNNRCQK